MARSGQSRNLVKGNNRNSKNSRFGKDMRYGGATSAMSEAEALMRWNRCQFSRKSYVLGCAHLSQV